ncbi:hypothetical protein L596_000296 [Steinernema carpocapsae]|uniref:Uncharacterized protein n=1 Tax=Steinernema carpocapsae TaxID=34508 RepID=A0A4U8UIC7_STECR|nr:hypothetical protein L596_000296 [Steinernema carpocapsae]
MVFVVNYARPDQDSRTKRPRRSLSSPEEAPEATRTQSALLFRKVFASSIRQKCVLFLLRPMTTHRENRCAESEKISIPLAQNCNSPGEEVDSPFRITRLQTSLPIVPTGKLHSTRFRIYITMHLVFKFYSNVGPKLLNQKMTLSDSTRSC